MAGSHWSRPALKGPWPTQFLGSMQISAGFLGVTGIIINSYSPIPNVTSKIKNIYQEHTSGHTPQQIPAMSDRTSSPRANVNTGSSSSFRGHSMKHMSFDQTKTRQTKMLTCSILREKTAPVFGLENYPKSEINGDLEIQLQPGHRMAKKVRFVALSP